MRPVATHAVAVALLLAAAAAESVPPEPANTAHAHDDPVGWMLTAEELEWRQEGGDGDLHWDVVGWLGRSNERLWLRSEGEREPGGTAENQLELLGGRMLTPWWEALAGVRVDSGDLPTRAYAAFGVQGEAPQWVHVEATAYVGDRADVGLRLQADYELRFTQKLLLGARAEAEWWSDDEDRAARGTGQSAVTGGLRLRYELRPEFAPYAGLEWQRALGDSAAAARDDREPVSALRWVAGLRFWF